MTRTLDQSPSAPTGGDRRRRFVSRRAFIPGAVLALLASLVVAVLGVSGVSDAGTTVGPPTGCTPSMNPVQCENSQPGTAVADSPMSIPYTSDGDPTIQGFATSMSVDAGQTVYFKVDAPTVSAWHINIFRMGYYQGLGAREWASDITPSVSLPQSQPACEVNPGGGQATGLVDCGNWATSAYWQVPSYAVSGLYIALLIRNDTGGVSEVPFVVRDDGSTADIVYQTSDATWEAYNAYNPPGVSNPNGTGIDGGNSLYQCYISCPPGTLGGYVTTPATEVSYNRPLQVGQVYGAQESPFYAEIAMIQFLEENGYNVTYISEVDTDSTPSALTGHKIFISSGHDEYWSANMRNNVEAALKSGVNLAFFSGNEDFWKTQYLPDPIDGTPERTLQTYKETHNEPPYGTSPNQYDPDDPPTWTGTWRDPEGAAPDDGDSPENSLTGQYFMVNSSGQNDDIDVPYQYAGLQVWKNTAVAKLTSSSAPVVLGANLGTLSSQPSGFGTLGYEWDIDADNGFRPAGEIDMSSTTDNVTSSFVDDYGTVPTGNDTPETHHLTLYRASSGALVFGAGTVQFSWGLNNNNPMQNGTGASDPNMQQFVVNLFAMMGVQPATLMSGLVPGAASNNTTAPTSTITSPAANSTLQDGTPTTITGTATDPSGGVVAGVEVSYDGGTTWHPASILGADSSSVTWTYSWQDAHGTPMATIESRATDDSGNIETPTDAETVNISCGFGCSIFGSGYTPALTDSGGTTAVTVGLKFTSTTFGTVNGVRFYKATDNTGTHVGMLWTSSGQLLAQATFTGETASGWQSVLFSTPVPINPNTTYVVGYYAPKGHNSEDDGALEPNPLDNGQPSNADAPPLHALRNTPANPNGVYINGDGFPTLGDTNPGGDNYGVDLLFSPQPAPGPASSVVASSGYSSATLSWSAPTSGGPVTSYIITPYIGSSAQPTTIVSGSPAPTSGTVASLTNGTTYTFTVTASNPEGFASPATSNAVTPNTSAPPVFIQQASAHASSVSTAGISVTPSSDVTAGNRLVVEVGAWRSGGANATNVTDSAGDSFTELSSSTSADGAQMSIWTAPITNSGGTMPKVTATPSAVSDMAIAVMEYAGLSLASGTGVLDQVATATGTTTSAATVQSGSTATSSGTNELALGFYADDGFEDNLSAGSGFSPRVNVSPTSDVELLAEDQVLASPGSADASVATGASTTWLMATVILKSAASSPPTVPSAPTNVTAVAGNGSAAVSWTAPPNGGALISDYTVTPYIGTTAQSPVVVSNSPAVTSAEVNSLTPGTSYTFTVSADNSIGTGPASTPSNAVTPSNLTQPSAPTNVTASAGNASATVSWTAPTNNGGTTITSYTVTPEISGNEGVTELAPVQVTGTVPPTSTVISSLTNGTAYIFTVAANNGQGQGPTGQSPAVTPATVPGAPTGVSATAGAGLATVAWTDPANNGGSSITSYTITPFIGSSAQTSLSVTAAATATSATVTGLTDGTTYSFTVTAANTAGAGAASGLSNTVTPTLPPTAPLAPLGVTATAGNGSVTVAWTAPPNGGATISSYTVTPYAGSVAGTAMTISGSPPTTSATFTTLTNATTYTFTVSATNSAGTGAASGASNLATPTASTPSCPCSIFGSSTPAEVDSGDTASVNLGVAFTVDRPGYVTGVRFYKASTNLGTHVGSLWSSTGTLLAQATFTSETASGWQQVSFSSPVAVTVGTVYVASYLAPDGHYSFTSGTFASSNVNAAPVYGLATTTFANGTFLYGSSSAFPTSTYNAANYWVDPVFSLTTTSGTTPGVPTAVTATAGNGSVTVAWTAPSSSGSSTISSYTVTPYAGSVAGTAMTISGSPPTTSATFTTLTNATTYTFTVSATNSAGTGAASGASNLATPTASTPSCPCSIFGSSTPAEVDSGDTASVNLGVAFTVDRPGYVTGVRFYKASTNLGTHVGSLWSSTGTLLAQATFTSETASGWQQVSFSSPVAVTVGTVYVASYLAPDGHYSFTSGTFASSNVNAAPVYGLATTTFANGTFLYGSSSAFPTSTYNAANYWVDPVFSLTTTSGTTPGVPTAVTATAGNGSVTVAWTAPSSSGSSTISSYTVTPYAGSVAGTAMTISGSPPTTSATFTTLTNATTYTFTVSATNSAGTGAASGASNLATPTASTPSCPCSIFGSSTPAEVDSGDTASVNLGVAFTVDRPGYVTGVRFYKASTNLGTHVGSLWSSTGTLLAQATFTSETASGWQQVSFSSPVAVTVGTVYVASYLAPDGHYSFTSGTFASSNVNAAPVYGLATTTFANGTFLYGSSSAFPTSTYNAANYWVDPVFSLTTTSGTTPGVPTAVTATAGNGSVTVAWTAPSSSGSSTISSYTVTPYAGSVAGTAMTISGSPPTTSATFTTLTNATTYTFTVSATNSAGTGAASGASNLATPTASTPSCPCSIFGSSTPAEVDSGDTASVNLGAAFTVDRPGYVTGVRFYKASTNLGTHVGSLWSSTGTLLAQATFTSETASGWQQVSFSSPVAVTVGTVYVASYLAPDGHYSFTSGTFASSNVNAAPVYGLATTTHPDGLYLYGTSSAYPTSTYNAANYWVDPIFSLTA